MRVFYALFLLLLAALYPHTAEAADPGPRSVLLLDQSEPNAPFGLQFRAALRASLYQGQDDPITIYSEVMDIARFGGPGYDAVLRDYLREKYKDKKLGVIVAHGSAALELLLRLRDELWPGVPVVFALVDELRLAQLKLPPDVTGHTVRLKFEHVVRMAQTMVPGLKRIALVGDKLEGQPFFGHFAREIPAFKDRFEFIDLTGLPLEEVRERVAHLPDNTAIYYSAVYRSQDGRIYISRDALPFIAEKTNRPIVSSSETHLGFGSAGGMMAMPVPTGEEAGKLALRILAGERAQDIPIAPGQNVKPLFDWRELRRWNISESSLPQGAEIRFRTYTLWEQYRWQILGILGVLVFQAGLIAVLLFERHRRMRAEQQSRSRLVEMAQMDRALTLGVMSTSIAHELNQPLGAILNNAEAAEILLKQNPPDLDQIREILFDIRKDDERAGAIIGHLRGFLKRGDLQLSNVELNDVVSDVLNIVEPEAVRRGVTVDVQTGTSPAEVKGDRVLLQQVLLNLALNGMDAMQKSESARRLKFATALVDDSKVEVSVSDTGSGIPESSLKGIFDSFVTTKQQGTGLGLSIARTIVENFGGRIWAENRQGGGAVFRFELPLTRPSAA
jgi:signal transduction histidine kinase